MPSRTQICNLSLLEIGEEPISDIEGTERNATRCKLIFDNVVDTVCVSKYWSKLKQRVELALLPDPPIYGFNFQFALPSDHLQILSINDRTPDRIQFQIEKNNLLVNESAVFIKYIQKQRNPEQWGELLETAVVYMMSARLGYIVTGDRNLQNDKYALYDKFSRSAATLDSNQGSRRKIRATTLTGVR